MQPEVKNRRVLRDIGNLAPAPAVEGKQNQTNRPITRLIHILTEFDLDLM